MTTDLSFDLAKEAKIFARYLCKTEVRSAEITDYINSLKYLTYQPTPKDLRLNRFVLKFPFLLGCIDGGLALSGKESLVRKKLILMFCLLETSPHYAGFFIAKESASIFPVIFSAIRAAARGLIGWIIIKMI